MLMPTPAQDPPASTGFLFVSLAVLAAFGAAFMVLPPRFIQTTLGLGLLLGNLIAFVFLWRRSGRPDAEQAGWRILAWSLLVTLGANVALALTPTDVHRVGPADATWVCFQVAIGGLQARALLAWPFASATVGSARKLNLLGGAIFGASLLLLIWSTTGVDLLLQGNDSITMRMTGLTLRVAVVGGFAGFLLSEDPRRLRGPLGWILVGYVLSIVMVVLARPYLYDAQAIPLQTPLYALALSAPLSFIGAARDGRAVDQQNGQARVRRLLVESVTLLPFMASGVALAAAVLRHSPYVLATVTGFLAVCGLLLVRQVLLLRELRHANERLEERVAARTRALEDMHGLLLRTERMNSVATLGAGLAHDLNNALTVVRSTAEVARLQADAGRSASIQELDRILVAAEQSSALTRRLMDFARRKGEPPGPVELTALVRDLEAVLQMLLPRKVALAMELADAPLPVVGSRDRLEQVLVNLVANARDAMPDGGRVTIRLRRDSEGRMALLEVADAGHGMPPEVVARLFEPFFTTKPAGQGTGLGLASVRVLVEELGGAIQVETTPGAGATFRLSFPLVD